LFRAAAGCLCWFLVSLCAPGIAPETGAGVAGAAEARADKAGGAALVRLETSMGNIYISLDEEKAPVTCANFRQYVEEGFYDGTVFHRVINNFMIQGGGMDVNLKQKATRAPIINEAANGLVNEKYSVAMARTSDPHSATSHFFINVKDNPSLNFTSKDPAGWGYAVFGKVVQGQEVVDKIKAVPTTFRKVHQDVPGIPVLIKKAVMVDRAI
jgi:peptidyl-prolyl cis-trans isomerase B (cyclophilin B)